MLRGGSLSGAITNSGNNVAPTNTINDHKERGGFDVETCKGILIALQREGAELIGDGVRRPSVGRTNKKSLNLCQIGDVLISLSFDANQVEAKLKDSVPEREKKFRELLGIGGNIRKMELEVFCQGQLNLDWVKKAKDSYQDLLGKLTSGREPFLYKKFDWRRKQFDPPEKCSDIVEELDKSLLFAMSHGSHELFHTNVWAWLVRRHPEFAKVFFDDIDTGAIKDVWREQGHRDLTIWVDVNGARKAYVVENKFKSSARENQLIEYKNALSESFTDGLLVTLDTLPEWFRLPEGWKNKRQSDIVKEVTCLLRKGHYDEKDPELGLVATYADITSQMSDLFDDYRKELGERWALALNHSEWDEFKSGDLEVIRLADIFKKMNASDFKGYLEKTSEWAELRSRVKNVSDPFDLVVTTDFLHKLPVVNCNLTYKGSNNDESHVGVILQGNSFGRVACSYAECWDEKRIYSLFKECSWFDDKSFLRTGLSLMRRTKKDYKQYDTDKYSFVYQDIGIESDAFDYLVRLVIDNMKTAVGLLEQSRLNAFFGFSKSD